MAGRSHRFRCYELCNNYSTAPPRRRRRRVGGRRAAAGGYISRAAAAPYVSEMDFNHYNGERVVDPAKFIRLTLRGHYVRWRLDNELAGTPSTCGLPPRQMDRRPAAARD